MGEALGAQKGREVKNAGARPAKSKAKPQKRNPQPISWRRMPKRQRERIIRIFMFVFLALFVLSVAGGLVLMSVRAPAGH